MYDASLKTIQGHQFKNWSAAKSKGMENLSKQRLSTNLICDEYI